MSRFLKPICFILSSMPLCYLLVQIALYSQGKGNDLGADPGKEIVLFLGFWAMVLLLVTLTVTPAQKLLGIRLFPVRRMLGLYTFTYASLHLTAYLSLLLEFDFAGLWADVIKRPYITVGMAAFLGLLPLALTSNRYMQRRLKQNWSRLHKLIYLIAIFVLIHFFWQTRSDFTEPLMYSALLAVLLGYRLFAKQGGWPKFKLLINKI